MIGVVANPSEHEVVREFFELFKTPWEFYEAGCNYDVVLCTGEIPEPVKAAAVIVYSTQKLRRDGHLKTSEVPGSPNGHLVSQGDVKFPVYSRALVFEADGTPLLSTEGLPGSVAFSKKVGDTQQVRVGFDLFAEIRTLLTAGQPRDNAGFSTLDLHISFLRDVITACGVPLVEIPPVPEGHQFIVCLTHDVDHPSVRAHKFDHTTFGFFLRAVFGSFVDLALGRLSFPNAVRNWFAAAKWPLVHLGVARDFWSDFGEKYLELEGDLPSTFFLIPRKGYAGRKTEGAAPALRAAGYEAKELAPTIRRLLDAGREIGLHGIDAWIDSETGHKELEEIRNLTGNAQIGTRMHWLYFNENSSAVLEKAGASYDSTFGYNVTVGFRAGTTQAYKPLNASDLLELPLHAMDTSLFYLSYLALSPRKASERLRQLTDVFAQNGGCFTINWHDRSLAPERFWGDTYRQLIDDLKACGAWFATCGQADEWFRMRRSAVFHSNSTVPGEAQVRMTHAQSSRLPGLQVRRHAPRTSQGETKSPAGYASVAVNKEDSASGQLIER